MSKRRKQLARWCWVQGLRLMALVMVGGFLAACLVRVAPGYSADPRALDARLSAASQQALRARQVESGQPWEFYVRFMAGLLRGDLGTSSAFEYPVRELIRERWPETARNLLAGWIAGCLAGWAAALASVAARAGIVDLLCSALAGALLSVPAALFGLIVFHASLPVGAAVAAVVFPKVFRYSRNLLRDIGGRPHLLLAKAMGLDSKTLLWHYILRPAAPQLGTVAAIAVNLAWGAAVPLEVVCDSPGLGKLAWEAALARDLPLLVTLTMLVTAVTVVALALAELGRIFGEVAES